MRIRKEDCSRFEADIKSAWSANQIMQWYHQGRIDDPILCELCNRAIKSNREMFSALGIMYTIITGKIPVEIKDNIEYVELNKDFMAHAFMDTYYIELHMWNRCYDDTDYDDESEWRPTMYLAFCDKRILDPTRLYRLYTCLRYGRRDENGGAVYYMDGGNPEMVENIKTDIGTLIEMTYYESPLIDEFTHGMGHMIGQDLERSYVTAIPRWLDEMQPPTMTFAQRYPELLRYIPPKGGK